jgi:aminomethyltransferase
MAEGRKTPLYARHEELGAKFVEFGGWLMPVSYQGDLGRAPGGAHIRRDFRSLPHGRNHRGRGAGLGSDPGSNDQRCVDPAGGKGPVFPPVPPDGGIIDDIIVYRRGKDFLLVVNAANREKDWAWLQEVNKGRAELADASDEIGLIAVQGPQAEKICRSLTDLDLGALGYFNHTEGELAGAPCLLSRTGYTGEDGWEIYMPVQYVEQVWDALLAAGGRRS